MVNKGKWWEKFSWIFYGIIVVGRAGGGISFGATSSENSMAKLTKKLANGVAQEESQRVAVLDFPLVTGLMDTVSLVVQERLTTGLVEDGRLEVVERRLLGKVKDELNLGMSGFVDTETAARIGKALGATVLISGTITNLGQDRWEVNARAIEVERGKIIVAGKATIRRDWEDLLRLANPESPFSAIPIASPPYVPTAEEVLTSTTGPRVIFRDPRLGSTVKFQEASLRQVMVVSDLPGELIVDVTYAIGEILRGKDPVIRINVPHLWDPDDKNKGIPATVGNESVCRLKVAPRDLFGRYTSNFYLEIGGPHSMRYATFQVPYEKLWCQIDSTDFYRWQNFGHNITMRIDYIYPTQPKYGELVQLVGEFGDSYAVKKHILGLKGQPPQPSIEIVMGGDIKGRRSFDVKKWTKNTILFKFPERKKPKRAWMASHPNDVIALIVTKYNNFEGPGSRYERSNIFPFQMNGATKHLLPKKE